MVLYLETICFYSFILKYSDTFTQKIARPILPSLF